MNISSCSTLIFRKILVWITLVSLPSFALACSLCDDQKVTFKGHCCSIGVYSLSLAGGTSNGGDANTVAAQYTNSAPATVEMTPDTEYPLLITGDLQTTHISFSDYPGCFVIKVKGGAYTEWTETDTIDTGVPPPGGWQVMITSKSDDSNSVGDGGDYLRSVHWRASLGRTSAWSSAGSLVLSQMNIDSTSYTPALLKVVAPNSEVDVIKNGAEVRQLLAPEALLDVITVSAAQYEVRYYRRADVILPKAGATYTVIAGAQPFLISRFENPVPANPNSGQLQMSEIRNGITLRSSLYTVAGNTWTLSRSGGKITEVRTRVVDGTGETTVTITKKNEFNQVSSSRQEIYHPFAWGEEVIARIEDVAGTPRRTDYTYYENAALPASYKRLKTIINHDGSWVRYDYTISSGPSPVLTTIMFEPWGPTPPTTPAAATVANSRVTTTVSSDQASSTNLVWNEVTETINGVQTSKSLSRRTIGAEEETTSYSSASASEVTSSSSNYNPGVLSTFNKASVVTYPDGRRDSITYAEGVYDPITHTFTEGAGKAFQTTVVHGTTAQSAGIALKTTRDTTVQDQCGNTVIVKSEVYTGGANYALLSETWNDYDAFRNLTLTTKNGRIVYSAEWIGMRKQSETDELGGVTTYLYDSLGRVESRTQTGVAAAGAYAAQPEIVTTYTYDSDNRVLSATRSAGGLILVSSTSYQGGRLSTQTDENGLTTTTTYSPDGLVTTTTRPDGATEIVTRQLDGQTKTITGTGVIAKAYAYGVNTTTGNQTVTEYIGPNGLASPRFVTTESNWLSRPVKSTKPGYSIPLISEFQNYGATGQTISQVSTGVGNTLFEYDELNKPFRSGIDVDNNGILNLGSSDRITETDEGFLQEGGQWFSYNRSFVYDQNGNIHRDSLGEVRSQLTGLPATRVSLSISIDPRGNRTVSTVDVDRAARLVTQIVDVPDSTSNATRVLRNGLLQSETSPTISTPTRYTYDALGRVLTITSPEGAVTTTVYVSGKNQTQSVTDHLNQTTSFTYYGQGQIGAGQVATKTNPDTTVLRTSYTLLGAVARVWGSSDYPIENVYNGYGQRDTLRTYRNDTGWNSATWPGGTATPDVTTWVFQPATGLLTSKIDAATRATVYQYYDTSDLRLKTRTWARTPAITTTYTYDPTTADLTFIDYSDATTDVTMTYDRRGRVATVLDAGGSRTLSYDISGQTTKESFSINPTTLTALTGVTIHSIQDNYGRLQTLHALAAGSTASRADYSYYPTDGRLEKVDVADSTARYTYEPTSNAVSEISFKRAGTERFKTSRTYDVLGRHSTIAHYTGATLLTSRASALADYDTLNRRTKRTQEDGLYWQYGYDFRGQVQFGEKHLAAGGLLAGWQFGYTYDAIGNRLTTTSGGDSTGANRRTSTYFPNQLNQYANRTVPAFIDIEGTSNPTANVTVNGLTADRQGPAWRKELPVANSTVAVTTTVTVAGTNGAATAPNQTGKLFTPKTPEVFTYDFDGNLTGDGRWAYTWDAENRLIAVQTTNAAALAGAPGIKRTYTYDYLGRGIAKTTYITAGAAGAYTYAVIGSVTRFLYSGWNLLAEIDAAGAALRSYAWGIDLSGSFQGAGGVGGLLFFEDRTAPARTQHAAASDEMGNIIALINTASGGLSASYEYGPFGEALRSAGVMAKLNPIRFSSKYCDDETGLLYYGYRYYSPTGGRWMSRDPIEEQGGGNLYRFTNNSPSNELDVLGLFPGSPGHGDVVSPDDAAKFINDAQMEADNDDIMFNKLGLQLGNAFKRQPTPVNMWLASGRNTWRFRSLINLYGNSGGALNTNAGNKFVYTCKFGWIDMGHFFRNAHGAYELSVRTMVNASDLNEKLQNLGGSDSAWSPEDLISNELGRDFGIDLYNADKSNLARNRKSTYYLDKISKGSKLMPVSDFKNLSGSWREFLVNAGAVKWGTGTLLNSKNGTKTVEQHLQDDLIDYRNSGGVKLYTVDSALEWAYKRSVHGCLCRGASPKDSRLQFK